MLIALVRINNIKINELKFISGTDLTQLLDMMILKYFYLFLDNI